MNKEIIVHLSKDPVMVNLVQRHQLPEITPETNLFLALVDIITSQQLSTKAGATIFNRLLDLLKPKTKSQITPQDLLNLSHDLLRSAGLSNSKANYIHSLAHAIRNQELDLSNLESLSDEEIISEITKLKGLGPWSAEMFLIFSLKRPDVFSVGDLGLRTAVANLYGVDRNDLKKINEISLSWSPHRSFASRLLWKSLDNA